MEANPSLNWAEHEKILSRFFAAHSIMSILPTKDKVGEYIAQLLKFVPGSAAHYVCLRGLTKPIGTLQEKQCKNCPFFLEDVDIARKCKLENKADIKVYPIKTVDALYGFMPVKITNTKQFASFDAILNNFANSTAMILENWRQKEQLEIANNALQEHKKHLEDLVVKRTEHLAMANKTLTILSLGNQALIRANNEQELLDKICEMFIKVGQYRLVWIGFVEHDKKKTISPVAHAGHIDDLFVKRQFSWARKPINCSSVSIAVRTVKPHVSNNMLINQGCRVCHEEAKKLGYASLIALPLVSNKKVFGVLNIYSNEPNAFEALNEVSVLNELADDLSYGIMVLRSKAEYKKIDKALHESEKRLREAQHIAHIGNWDWNIVANKLWWSDEIYRIFGLKPKQFGATYEAFFKIVHPDDRDYLQEQIKKSLYEKKAYDIDHRIVLPNGNIRFVREKALVVRDKKDKPIRMIGTVIDITKEKLVQQALQKTSRLLHTLSDANQTLIHSFEEQTLLNHICEIIVNLGQYSLACIAFTQNNKSQKIHHAAMITNNPNSSDADRFDLYDSKACQKVFKKAIDSKKPCIIRDIFKNTGYKLWRKIAKKFGFTALISIPLLSNHTVLGVMNIASEKENAFDKTEIKLLSELAGDLAYGIIALRRREELDTAKETLEKILAQTIKTIALTLEKRDPYTAGHQQQVAILSRAIAQKLGLLQEIIDAIYLGATIHDIGKIYIPAEILSRPGKLINEEISLLRTHCAIGYDIVKNINFKTNIPLNIILQHHERLDGTGYPKGLKRNKIPIESRIVAVADVMEAMASHRPYRLAHPINVALTELLEKRGKAYDAQVVDACVELFKKDKFKLTSI